MKMTYNNNYTNVNNQFAKDYKLAVASRLASLNPSYTKEIAIVNGEYKNIPYKAVTKFNDCGTKENPVVPSWLEKAPFELVQQRIEGQAQLRKEYEEELEKFGFAPKILEFEDYKVYGVERNGQFYTYSATNMVDEEGNKIYGSNYPLVSEWTDTNVTEEDAPVKVALKKYLGSFWLSEDDFLNKIGGKDNAAPVAYPGMNKEEALSFMRFMTSVTEANEKYNQNKNDFVFLQELLKGTPIKELLKQGLIPELLDNSRTKASEEKAKYFDSLSEENMVLWAMTRKAAKFAMKYDNAALESFDIKDYRNFMSFEEIVWNLKVYEGSQKRDANGNYMFKKNEDGSFMLDENNEKIPALVNSWTFWELMLPYYVSGVVTGADLAMSFFKYSSKAGFYGHSPEEQAAYQFENWAKQRKESLGDWASEHKECKDLFEGFCQRLLEDEIF